MVSKSQGFTLVELIVTIIIAGILAAVAYPAFNSQMANARAKTTANALYVSLLQARSKAAAMNINVTISPVGGNWLSGWQVACIQSGTNNCNNAGANLVYANEDALSGVTVSGAPASVVYLTSGRTQVGATVSFSIAATVGGSTAQMCVAVKSDGHPYVTSAPC